MSSLSQASRLAYLPSAHDAFQGHAAHRIEWSICLGPRTQRVPVYPQVLPHSSRLLHGAARPQTTTPPPPLLSGIGMSSGVSPFLLSTALGLLREASRVQHGRRKWNEVGGVLLSLPLPLFAAPQSWNRGEDRVTSVTIAKPFYLACLGPYAQRSFLISGSTG